jgi:hypothetical protein
MKRKPFSRHALVTILILCGACIGIGVGAQRAIRTVTMRPLRRALPPTAQDVHEWSWEEGGLTGQDYAYCLKAKITRSEFDAYVKKFNLTSYIPNQQYSNGFYPSWRCKDEIDWWTPSDDTSSTYVYDGGSVWTYAKYENGYVFVVSYNI